MPTWGFRFTSLTTKPTFAARVMDDFVDTYRRDRRPTLRRCNQHIKFTPLLRRAPWGLALATGHYARITYDSDGEPVLCAVDAQKDQSYSCLRCPKKRCRLCAFPLGGMTKDGVRAHARRLGIAQRRQGRGRGGLFITDGNYASFVEDTAQPSRAGRASSR